MRGDPDSASQSGMRPRLLCGVALLLAAVALAPLHRATAQQAATVSSGQLEDVRRKLAEIEGKRRESELESAGRARTPWDGEVTAAMDLMHRRMAILRLSHDEVSFGCVWTLDPLDLDDEESGAEQVRLCLAGGSGEYIALAPGRWRVALRAGDPASFALKFDPIEVSLGRNRAYRTRFTRREADLVSRYIRDEKKKIEKADRSESTAADPIPLEPGR